MLTFKYKDMRVRYQYMLAVSCASLLPMVFTRLMVATQVTAPLIFQLATYSQYVIIEFIFAFISLRGMNYKVKFTDGKVTINNKRIKLNQIQSIVFSENDISYTVGYGELKYYTNLIGKRESDEDIEVFRQALGELITRVKQYNPNVQIDLNTVGFITPESETYARVAGSVKEEKSKLKGIGGWLIYIILNLSLIGFMSIIEVVQYAKTLLNSLPNYASFIGSLLYVLIAACIVLFSIMLLISLFQKRLSFKKVYINYLVYVLIAERINSVLQYSLIDGKWPGTIGILNTFVIGVISSIFWLLAWRAYFERSIRVKNTFQDEIFATKTI